jgi:hypothetical protein
MMFSVCLSSGFQNVVSLIQQASFSTRSLNPKAWNISIVRQAMQDEDDQEKADKDGKEAGRERQVVQLAVHRR